MSSQAYLQRMGLLEEYAEDLPATLNSLYEEAFELFPKLTRALAFNQWFWDVYSGKAKSNNYNCHWWKVRSSFEGTNPPERRKTTDLDPATHLNFMSTPSQNIEIFITSILKYQIYETLCTAALLNQQAGDVSRENQVFSTSPSQVNSSINLQSCDLSGSGLGGDLISKLVSPGPSKGWKELLNLIGIKDGLNSSSLLTYFKPLYKYLKEVNSRREFIVGWKGNLGDYCKV